jgi:menaquinone-9 beta-reductase
MSNPVIDRLANRGGHRQTVDGAQEMLAAESLATKSPGALDGQWDVVVIGAGPAGSMAATLLARRGLKTLLIEKRKFPRYKVCGACLNPLSLSLLQSAGLEHVVADAVPLDRFCLQSRGRALKLDLPGSVSISRERLDVRLAQAAIDAGAEFVSNCAAKVLPVESVDDLRVVPTPLRQIELKSDDGNRDVVRASVVIAADGLTHGCLSRLTEFETQLVATSRLGAGTVLDDGPEFYEPGCIYMSSACGGYVGLVRLEDGRLNVAAAMDASAVEASGSLAAAARGILASAGFPPIESLNHADWLGTPTLTRSTRPLALQRVFLIGDAAGYVEPFTGEGIAWALASAASVVPVVEQAHERWDGTLEREWSEEWQRTVGRHLGWCRRLAHVLRHPLAVSALTRVVGICPWLARPVLRRLNRVPQSDIAAHHDSEAVRKAAG